MHPLMRTAIRQGVRYGAGRALSGAGPRTGSDVGAARPVPAEVLRGERPPAHDELLGRTTTAVGRFATVDPLVAPGWRRRRGRVSTLLGYGVLVAAVVRRRLAA